jgi:hypothetical protein
MMRISTQTPESAKQFLLSKLCDQARRDGVVLSDLEQGMFAFSEATANDADLETVQKFDGEYDSSAYESKITRLLRRAYGRDKKNAIEKSRWKDALAALREEDFYGLVMVDQARIPRPKSYGAMLSVFNLRDVLFGLLELGILGVGVVLVFDPLHLGLIKTDWLRLFLMAVFVGIFWFTTNIYARKMLSRTFGIHQRDSSK